MKPCTVARSTVRGSGKPECQKRATHSPTPICLTYSDILSLAISDMRHQWLYNIRGMYITHLRGIHVALFFDIQFEIYQIPNRQNQSVVNAFSMSYPTLPFFFYKKNFRRRTDNDFKRHIDSPEKVQSQPIVTLPCCKSRKNICICLNKSTTIENQRSRITFQQGKYRKCRFAKQQHHTRQCYIQAAWHSNCVSNRQESF